MYSKKIFITALVFLLCLIISVDVFAANYRSRVSDDWSDVNTWEVEHPAGSGTWVPASSLPGTGPPKAGDNVKIVNGNTVIVAKAITVNELIVENGAVTGDGAGTNVSITADGQIEIKASGSVTTQNSTTGNTGNITLTSNHQNVVVDGIIRTGDVTQEAAEGIKGGDSGSITLKGQTIVKNSGCEIETGDAGDGGPGDTGEGGDGGNSGSITSEGAGVTQERQVTNDENSKLKIGEPGEGGTGSPPGTDGDRGKITEKGKIITMYGGGNTSVEGGAINFEAEDSLIFHDLGANALIASDYIQLEVPTGTLFLENCSDSSFISGESNCITAEEVVIDAGEIVDLMEPDPVPCQDLNIPTLSEWGLMLLIAAVLGLGLMLIRRRKQHQL